MTAYIVVLTLRFIQPLARLMLQAGGSNTNSHSLVPAFVGGYLLGSQRESLSASPRRSMGGTALPGGIGLASAVSETMWREVLSLNDYVALVALAFTSLFAAGGDLSLGVTYVAAAALAVAFMDSTVPLTGRAATSLERASALTSTDAEALYCNMVGMALVRRGTVFGLPGIVLELPRECSETRSSCNLFPFESKPL